MKITTAFISATVLTTVLATLLSTAHAAYVPNGMVIPTACAKQVQTQAKIGATDIVLATSLCRARIEGDTKDYYTVDAEVWELLHNKIAPPQVALVGKIASDNMIIWNTHTRMTIGSVEDDGTEILLHDGKRTVIGNDVRAMP